MWYSVLFQSCWPPCLGFAPVSLIMIDIIMMIMIDIITKDCHYLRSHFNICFLLDSLCATFKLNNDGLLQRTFPVDTNPICLTRENDGTYKYHHCNNNKLADVIYKGFFHISSCFCSAALFNLMIYLYSVVQ